MKAYLKTILRTFRHHVIRFVNIIAIIIVSVGFMSGIGESEQVIERAIEGVYVDQNVSDLIVKGSFSSDDCRAIESNMAKWGLKDIKYALSYDEEIDGDVVRFYYMEMGDVSLNKFRLVAGELPSAPNQVLVERKTQVIKSYEIGESIELTFMGSAAAFEVVGVIENPLIIINKDEPSYLDPDIPINNVIYFSAQPQAISDIYLTIEDRTLFDSFSSAYNEKIEELQRQINGLLPEAKVLGLKENYGISSVLAYADKVGLIAIIFVVFFLLVTVLVVFSNVTRLIDEERSQIACMSTLGYSGAKILWKYVLFIGTAMLIGGLAAWPVGYALTAVIYKSFTTRYLLPKMPSGGAYLYFLMCYFAILVSSLLVTWIVGRKTTKTKPALLLVPKAPTAGKKVLLERIPFIWNRFSFKYKSSLRNIFLFKSRFFMTVISVLGSTVLVFAGFGLLDCVLKNAMAQVISIISAAMIVFAGALCVLIVYNIASISISERNCEIATLKVLGYHNKEVVGYIFREIFITNLIAALLGLPLGTAFLDFVFGLVSIGSIADVNWWSFIVAPVVTMLFTALTIPLLYKKIVKTDMNASLKAIE